jgi:hypothetical protein
MEEMQHCLSGTDASVQSADCQDPERHQLRARIDEVFFVPFTQV